MAENLGILNRIIEARTTGNIFNPALTFNYPTMKRVATYQFDQPSHVVAMVLSSSLLNFDTQEMAVAVARGNNDFLNISNSDNNQVAASDVFMTQISHQNSAAGSLSPVSRTTAVSFSPRVAVIDYAAGGMISIYAASGNNASSLIATTLSIYFIQKDV